MSGDNEEIEKRRKKMEEDRRNEERQKIDLLQVWMEVQKTISSEKVDLAAAGKSNSGWKTVRVFVSSTFKDFHTERDELVKQVFPDLRIWCEERRIHLVECDLRWGVPEETPYETTLRICMAEIDRCFKDNVMPYFLNMTSKRIGWIPLKEELTEATIQEFNLIIGLSITEMEIIHAAYRHDNPNSLFLIRDDSFLENLDEDLKGDFVDVELNPIADKKLKILKEKIEERFPKDNVVRYNCRYKKDEKFSTGRPKFRLQDGFSEKVLKFFKRRISEQYPLTNVSGEDSDKYAVATAQHKDFMKVRGFKVIGRRELADEILKYISSSEENRPVAILGEPGAGKSAVMAMVANEIDENKEFQGLLFYHFIGATPDSTSLFNMLSRLLHDLKRDASFQMPIDLSSAIQEVLNELEKKDEEREIVLFIDAVNQFDKDTEAQLYSWLPEKLHSKVKCILSMIVGSNAHSVLKSRKIQEMILPDLDIVQIKDIANDYLIRFRKKLSEDQIFKLVAKKSSKYPLWLKIACEELRVFGDFELLTQQITDLPDTLTGLLKYVLERFAVDMVDKNDLLKSTLCLLEVSKSGLLEVELLELLAAVDGQTEVTGAAKPGSEARLVSYKWAAVYRNLQPFLRPFGNSREGRLDFYHRSLSKVVREEYLNVDRQAKEMDDVPVNENYIKWHRTLASYFQSTRNYERKIEEYPFHLIRIGDTKRLEDFLLDWKAFDLLFNKELSENLLKYWREIKLDDYSYMAQRYINKLDMMKTKSSSADMITNKLKNVGRLLTQAGLYDPATKLVKECLDLTESEPESEQKQRNLIDLYGHIAEIETLKITKQQRQSTNDNASLENIIKYHEKVIHIIDSKIEKRDKEIQRIKAFQLVRKGFCLAQLADRCFILMKGKQKKYRDDGLQVVNEAIKIYKEINDMGQLIEAYLTEATLYTDMKERHRVNNQTMDLCKQIYGPVHVLMARTSYNDGLAYEAESNNKEAYQCFKKSYLIGKELFGPNHTRTKKYRKTLSGGKYEQQAKKKKVPTATLR